MNKFKTPGSIIGASIAAFIIFATVSSIAGVASPLFYLNESQILYLFSTSSQVLAAIYGLTLTGFIFFRNELSREEFDDQTLVDAVENLKQRYYKLLVFITLFSILTLSLSNFAISCESSNNSLLNLIAINSGQSAFFINLSIIAYFVFDVISPERIEVASRNLQNQVDPTSQQVEMGSLEEFIKNYNVIETLLAKYGLAYQQSEITSFTSRPVRRISNVRLAEILFRSGQISESLLGELRSLITLRNSIIHGAEPVVSSRMVQMSNEIQKELSKVLTGYEAHP